MFDVPPVAKAEVKVPESAPLMLSEIRSNVSLCKTQHPKWINSAPNWRGLAPSSALFLPQRACQVTQVQGVGRDGRFPAALRGLARINVHGLGNGVHGVFAQIPESLARVLLPDALLEGLALVSELDDGLGVGVDGGDGRAHAAGERRPGHADRGR